ncbi:GNAT family N-acetyltransferase [Rossellomorea marisflavi]|uniref:GNAT family N-acetyltransferase n=1 Tax=Rossellomorea marisflavi TaxID=189381 RepID=UPI00295F5253|nr:N-acetyltransferase [Rossellomorea marisflavi]
MKMDIRIETPEDYNQTEAMIRLAFKDELLSDQTEHELVRRIRNSGAFVPELSLVAWSEQDGVIGHTLLSKVAIVHEAEVLSLALAPVSVRPDHQNRGIGRRMINSALERAADLGFGSVIVLGHPEYYPRFGFVPASRWGIKAPFDVPDDALMALELIPGALNRAAGVVRYPEAFS